MKTTHSVFVALLIILNSFSGVAKAEHLTHIDFLLNYGIRLQALVDNQSTLGYSFYKKGSFDVFTMTQSDHWYTDFLEGFPWHNSLDERESFFNKSSQEIDSKRTLGLDLAELDCIDQYLTAQTTTCLSGKCPIFEVQATSDSTESNVRLERGDRIYYGRSFAQVMRQAFEEELTLCSYRTASPLFIAAPNLINSVEEDLELLDLSETLNKAEAPPPVRARRLPLRLFKVVFDIATNIM